MSDNEEKQINWREEYIKCSLDFEYCATNYFKVFDKINSVYIPFKLMPHQIHIINELERVNIVNGKRKNNFTGINKYRQAGVTSILAAYIAWKINFINDFPVAVVANVLKLAKDEILKKITSHIEQIPKQISVLHLDKPKKQTQDEVIYANGSSIKAFAAEERGIRGFSPRFVLVDEAAFLENGKLFWEASRMAVSAGGDVCFISTPNGRDPVFYAEYNLAQEGTGSFKFIEIHWFEDPRYNQGLWWEKGDEKIYDENPANFDRYREEGYKPKSDWFIEQCQGLKFDEVAISRELEGRFDGSGASMIPDVLINQIQDTTVADNLHLIKKLGDGNAWQWEAPIKPDQDGKGGALYILSADISTGTGSDFSTIEILKVVDNHYEQVFEYQGKVPPDEFAAIILHHAANYNMAYLVIDGGGVGLNVVGKVLEEEYPNFHYSSGTIKKEYKERFDKWLKKDGRVPGFVLSASNRPQMLDTLRENIQNKSIIIKSSRLLSEFRTFVWDDRKKRYDHTRSTHDDLIMALAMGIYAYEFGYLYNKNKTKKDIKRLEAYGFMNSRFEEKHYDKNSHKNQRYYHGAFSYDNNLQNQMDWLLPKSGKEFWKKQKHKEEEKKKKKGNDGKLPPMGVYVF